MNLNNYVNKPWDHLPSHLDTPFAYLNQTTDSFGALTGWTFVNHFDDLDWLKGAYVVKEDGQRNVLWEYALVKHRGAPREGVEVVMDSRLSYFEHRKGLVSLLTDLDFTIDTCVWVRPMNALLQVYQQDVDNHHTQKKKPEEVPDDLAGELADILHSVTRIANEQGINLDEAWARMMVKYELSESNRYERKK